MEECFVRVETIQLSDMQSVGGYMCAVNSLLALFLGIKPTDDAEELVQLSYFISYSKDSPSIE